MNKQAQVLRINSREQFNWLIEHLRTETHRAHDHWNFWGDFEAALGEYSEELNQAPEFWELTRQAHKDSVILRLGRLFDPTKGVLSFGNLLQTIRHHATATAPTFLSADLNELDLATLDLELTSVSEDDAAVSSLLAIRNQYLAHREARIVGTGTFSSLPKLERTEIESLLERALRIVRKYTQICGIPRLSWGRDEDFQRLLKLLRSGLTARRAHTP
jgi:hypothetical protein